MLTVKDAASILKCSTRQLAIMIRYRGLYAVDIGTGFSSNYWRIPEDSLDRFIRSSSEERHQFIRSGHPPFRIGAEGWSEVMTLKEVGSVLRCNAQHVADMISQGKLAALDIGMGNHRQYRVHREKLEEFIQPKPVPKDEERERRDPARFSISKYLLESGSGRRHRRNS